MQENVPCDCYSIIYCNIIITITITLTIIINVQYFPLMCSAVEAESGMKKKELKVQVPQVCTQVMYFRSRWTTVMEVLSFIAPPLCIQTASTVLYDSFY